MECEYCKIAVKSKYILKTHLTSNKACLKLRGLSMESKFVCSGCNMMFMNNSNLNTHIETCKKYILSKINEQHEREIEQLKNNNEREIEQLKNNNEEEIKQLKNKHLNDIRNIKLECKDEFNQKTEKYKELEVRYDELKIRYDELSKQHEKTIDKLELKISQCDTFIQNLAREASNKPTTTNNNTINNSIRNHLSPTFTIDKLEEKKLEETIREHYTEFDYFCGQRGLANFLVERIIKTPDEKMMICCTDTSRKKFKILDVNGNLKEDIQARLLCQKIKEPTSIVTKEMYEKIINRIDEERKRLSDNDQSRKSKLSDDFYRAQQYYLDNMNFDDINYNGDFINELCVLLNV